MNQENPKMFKNMYYISCACPIFLFNDIFIQDTVVGLQALATYFAKFPVSSKRGVDVKLRWKGGMHSFNTIQTKNYDIFQQFKVQ